MHCEPAKIEPLATPASASRLVTVERVTAALTILVAFAIYGNLLRLSAGSRYILLFGDCGLALLAGYLVAARLLAGKFPLLVEALVACLMSIGLLAILHPNIPNLTVGLEGFRQTLFQMLAVFVGTALLNTRTRLIGFLKTVSILSIPVLLWAIRQFFIISPIDFAIIDSNTAGLATWQIFGKYRAFGFFSGPFHMGLFAGFIFWIGLAFYGESRRKEWLALALVSAMACLATLTRSSLMALFAGVPLVMIYIFGEYRFRIIVISTALLTILLSSVFLIATNVDPVDSLVQSVSSLEEMSDDSRFEGRLDGYREGIRCVYENPFGIGMGSAADAIGYQFEGTGHKHITSHNILLRMALETGWIGLCLFLAILWQLVRAVNRLKTKKDYWLAAVIGGWLVIMLITGITGSSINAYPINLLFWLVAGGIVSYSLTPIEGGNNVQ